MDKRTRPMCMLPMTEKHKQTESEVLEKNIACKCKQKESGVAIAISDKIDFLFFKGTKVFIAGNVRALLNFITSNSFLILF